MNKQTNKQTNTNIEIIFWIENIFYLKVNIAIVNIELWHWTCQGEIEFHYHFDNKMMSYDNNDKFYCI